MNPMVFVTYLCGYFLVSALLALIPSSIAKSKQELWWLGSFLILMSALWFPIWEHFCYSPLIALVAVSVAVAVVYAEDNIDIDSTDKTHEIS